MFLVCVSLLLTALFHFSQPERELLHGEGCCSFPAAGKQSPGPESTPSPQTCRWEPQDTPEITPSHPVTHTHLSVYVVHSLTLEQMFVAEVRRTEAALLISMFQTYSLGRLALKPSAWQHDSSRLLLFLCACSSLLLYLQLKGKWLFSANPPSMWWILSLISDKTEIYWDHVTSWTKQRTNQCLLSMIRMSHIKDANTGQTWQSTGMMGIQH